MNRSEGENNHHHKKFDNITWEEPVISGRYFDHCTFYKCSLKGSIFEDCNFEKYVFE
jgi:fluoroquinolone resistance protein